ncbi:MAG: hypothetical protein AAFP86_06530, partial [Planctomycetota bacterium]
TAFRSNTGQFGGALFVGGGTAHVEECVFEDNVATGQGMFGCGGGAVASQGSAQTTLVRCVLTGNTADDDFSTGGGAVLGAALVDECTLVDNRALTGTASALADVASVRSSIVRGGTAPRVDPGTAVAFSNVEGGPAGPGNFDADPRFWGAPADVGLLPDSPCIDAGDPAGPLQPDLTPRDVGALQFDPLRCGPGCAGPVGSSPCTSNVNASGADARLVALGSSAVAEDRFVLAVDDVPRGQFGFFLASPTGGLQALGGGSDGVLCLGTSGLLRIDDDVLIDRGLGAIAYRPDLGDLEDGNAVLPGATWHFQYWFRDLTPTGTSNTSSSVAVTFR